jgi:branched-chain amino acid aminotransferase
VTPSHVPLPAWVDDRLLAAGADAGTAVVSAYDTGLRSGLGVFETLRAHGTATLAVDRHLDRLAAGARRLGIGFERAETERALETVLAAPRPTHEVVVRITLTGGPLDLTSAWPPAATGRPCLVITLHPAPSLPLPPGHAVTTTARRWPADLKTTSYVASLLATGEARAAGADIGVLVDGDELLETAEGNLFAVDEGALVTPPDDGRLLPGVTRSLLIETAADLGIPCRTEPLHRADVVRIEALALSSSVAGLRTILSLDGSRPGGGTCDSETEHPLIVTLRDRLVASRS